MSLWHESLFLSLNDRGDNRVERARCILHYLSMPVPRSWWERALALGYVDKTHASLIRDLALELSPVLNLGNKDRSALLVALAFGDNALTESGSSGVDRLAEVEDYLTSAKKVLAERPDLAQIGMMIDEA